MLWIAILLVWLIPATVMGAEPMDTLKGPIDRVITILNDPQYQGDEQKQAQRQKLWDTMFPIFDYTFIAKSVLGRFHWNNTFSPAQQEEFIDVFSRFIGNNYLDKIQEGYENEKVIFVDEELLSPSKAIVKTQIPRKDYQIPVDYLMRRVDGQWKIYDVNIENVSLIENYRSQIRSILIDKSAAELIEQLKSKLKE